MLTFTATFQDELVFKQPLIDCMIDWWLTPTLTVFQLYRGDQTNSLIKSFLVLKTYLYKLYA